MVKIVRKDSNRFKEIIDGIKMQNLAIGNRTHMVRFFLAKGKFLPLHHHVQEQTGYMIRGKMILNINGKPYTVVSGDSWSIGSNIPHSAEIIEDCEVIEVFSPIREDYLD